MIRKGDTIPSLPKNALPVFYGDDYTDLASFLNEIGSIRLRKRSGLNKIVAVNPYVETRKATTAFARLHYSSSFIPFVGRKEEFSNLNDFLGNSEKLLWWTVTGAGGIGKSRLIFEFLRQINPSWYEFFTHKNCDEIRNFKPFTNTIVVFDYVLGEEKQCADALAAYLEAFELNSYKLRIIFIERNMDEDKVDWLGIIKSSLDVQVRINFEACEYKPTSLYTVSICTILAFGFAAMYSSYSLLVRPFV